MDKYIGKKLDGRYEILEVVGVGGMANVYKAHDVLEDKIVAVKILRDEFVGNDEFLRRFKNESKAIAVLSHPNIVKVHDVSFTDMYQFIVMEFVNGITFKDYISQQGQLSWKEVVHFTIEILRALQHAHDKGIVHRDIKPHNIMLLHDGTVKVMDFGIARFARSETRTMTDKAIGSVHYISPEQARGDTTDEKTDIYSVGVMMFEMLTGQLPFEADNAVSVAIKQISAKPKRPRELNPNIPEGLEEIVIKAMQKDAVKRYHTASEMLRDIDEFKKNPSIHFEYKYMSQDSQPTMYYDAVMRKSNEAMEKKKEAAKNQKRKGRSDRQEREDDDEDRKSAVIPIMTGVAMAFVLCALVFVAYVFIVENPFARVPEINMPTLVGLPLDAAKNLKDCSEFEWDIVAQEYTTEYAEGVIYEQNPVPNRLVKVNATIEVKVSLGISKLIMPELSNWERQQALAKLDSMGLIGDVEEVFDDVVAEGHVVRTSPSFGAELQEGATITLYISKGPELKEVKVPDLTDMTRREAELILESMNLKLGEVTEVDSEKTEGLVVGQAPQPETEIQEGSAVDIEISNGKGGTYGFRINIELPLMNEVVTVTILADQQEVYRENVNPFETRIIPHDFTLKEDSIVEVLINGDQLKIYTFYLDSEGKLQMNTRVDNTDAFE